MEIEEDCVHFALRGNEERMYLNICCPESQRGDQPFQSCGFFEKKKHFTWKLKKMAYFSLSGEMKKKCI